MLQLPPLARNIEEVSTLAQYFTLVAASRNHNNAHKKSEAVAEQLTEAKSETVKSEEIKVEPQKAAADVAKNSDESFDPSKGQKINILF
jgi:signal-transduction protein with cAMP-binding, CBS, and nucleotidyltransferase domain